MKSVRPVVDEGMYFVARNVVLLDVGGGPRSVVQCVPDVIDFPFRVINLVWDQIRKPK